MDESSGTVATDSSGDGHQAQLSGGAAWAAGKVGNALALDGRDDRAVAADHPDFDLTQSITLAAWLRPDKVGTQYPLKKARADAVDGYELSLSGAGKVFVRFNQYSSGNTYRLDSTTSYQADQWIHVAATYDGTVIRLYVNGNQQASLARTFTIRANSVGVGLGAQDNGVYPFDGLLDDARIYNRALSSAEIASLFEPKVPNTPPNVNAGPDQTVVLPSSAALDGTVTDDGLPNPPGNVSTTWSLVSGPGPVTFADAGAVDTTASFSASGTYNLRLTASDGEFSSSDVVRVTVENAIATTEIEPLNRLVTSAATGEKPQSKVWEHGGRWWAVLPNSSGTWLWRLDGDTWTAQLKLSTRTSVKADAKVVGDVTHVLLYTGASSTELVSVEYVSGSTPTYKLWSDRSAASRVTLDSGVEIATIDVDSTGRMWLASDGSTDIRVRYSDAPYTQWSAPIVIASGVTTDDISAVIAMPQGRVGVLWSDQNSKRFGFRTHADGGAPETWSADEVPASQSAIANVGGGMADDHINLKVASDGTLYAAVKTSYDSGSYTKIGLLVRRPTGAWDRLYNIDNERGTRPIVALNEAEGTVAVFYTNNSGDPADIVYKKSSLSDLSFGTKTPLITGAWNNVSSAKGNYTDDLVVIASNGSEVAGARMILPASKMSVASAFNDGTLIGSGSEDKTVADLVLA